ncbi:hypothetical protein D3C71_2086440 [compost metagenome]
MHPHVGLAQLQAQQIEQGLDHAVQHGAERRQQLGQGRQKIAYQAPQKAATDVDLQPLQQADDQAVDEGA